MPAGSQELWLKIAFDRRANAFVVVLTLGVAWLYLPFYIFLCAVLALSIFFVVGVRPSARRNRDAWNDTFARQAPERVQFVGGQHHFREWRLPLIIIVHSEQRFSVTRSLPNWNHEAFDSASICVSLPSRVLPLARYVLWRLGGILPSSRSVLLHLLGQRNAPVGAGEASSSSSEERRAAGRDTNSGLDAATFTPSGVVVAFYDDSALSVKAGAGGKQLVETQIASKSVISAALKTGAYVAPAVQLPEGTIFVGKPQQLLANEQNTVSSPAGRSSDAAAAAAAASSPAATSAAVIDAPSVEQVLAASDEYCALLTIVLQKAYANSETKVAR